MSSTPVLMYNMLATWLEGKASNTRRSTMATLRDRFDLTDGKHPGQVTPLDAAACGPPTWRMRVCPRCSGIS